MPAEAADLRRKRGDRLVLVVDGLEEDQGVVTRSSAYSVAGLLPASPPAGTRVMEALLAGTPLTRDLLGLVTAAVGGLTGADLAELTGTRCGRSRRSSTPRSSSSENSGWTTTAGR